MKSLRFWKKHGFEEVLLDSEKQQLFVEHYGDEARYIIAKL